MLIAAFTSCEAPLESWLETNGSLGLKLSGRV